MKPPPPFRVAFFLLSLAVFAFSIFRLPLATAEDESARQNKYLRKNTPLRTAVIRYHTEMNSLFNDHIEKLLSGRGVSTPPENDECPANNVSTYCLSLRAVEEYDAFKRALESHRPFISDVQPDSSSAPITLDAAGRTAVERANFIDDQIQIAEQVMDTALATYNQLQIFYPLHAEYQGLVQDLELYRDGVADVRREAESLPGKFQNVTTTDCT